MHNTDEKNDTNKIEATDILDKSDDAKDSKKAEEARAELLDSKLPDYKNEIVEIIRSNLTPKLIRDRISGYHENDIASAFELLKKDERCKLYSIIDTDTLSGVLEYAEDRNTYIAELGIRKRVTVLSNLEVTSAVEYLRSIDKSQRNVLIDLMEDEAKREIALLGSFDEDEIGSRMTTNYIAIENGLSIREAMRELVAQAADNDNISTIYVTDSDGTLVGGIDLKDLILAREGMSLDDIMTTSYPYVYASELIEDSIERIKDYSEDSIPVLDEDNKIKGVMTASDIGELANELFGDAYAKLGGLSSEEDLKEPLYKSVAKRLPWLIVLLGMGMIVSAVVGMFDHVVAYLPILVSYQSLVLGMAGNVGTQSLAVTIRVLMDDEVGIKEKLRLITKETRVGFLNGLIVGVLALGFIGLYLWLVAGETLAVAFGVACCTGIALPVSMLLSGLAGTAIPIVLKRLRIDPAVASGPMITTINDLVGVVSYYGIAWLMIMQILPL
ncbi:MAG: magnesium transporter [Clostridia bacterium]|nr:magnesium transporter [Clostridia bacterium]